MKASKKHTRFALVIGNGDYFGSTKLDNPVNDATKFSKALENLGFHVTPDDDLDHAGIIAKFEEFEGILKSSDNVDVALIYFSGHGFQVDDVNYILPISEGEIPEKLITIQYLLDRTAKHSRRRLFILDACRSYPNKEMLRDKLHKTRGFVVGGKPLNDTRVALSETFLAFSAAPGELAIDGLEGEALSPFTSALLKHIHAIDLPVNIIMGRVRKEVAELTDNKQSTWDNTSLTQPFFFNPSSMFFLIGNFIGLIAVIISFISYSFRLFESANLIWIMIGLSVVLLAFFLFLRGLHNAYLRIRGQRQRIHDSGPNEQKSFSDYMKQGAIGGLFGGIIGSPAVAVPYWNGLGNFSQRCTDLSIDARQQIPESCPPIGEVAMGIMVAGLYICCLLGALSLSLGNLFVGKMVTANASIWHKK